MKSPFLATALIGLFASPTALAKGHGTGQSGSVDKSDGLPFTDIAFYTRMSFYTPEDENATIIVDVPFSYNRGSQMPDVYWEQYDNYGDFPIVVTNEDTNELVMDWKQLVFNTTGSEFSFPLAQFPSQEEAYHLRLWAATTDNAPLFQSRTLLRVLPEEDAKNLARYDRLLQHVQVKGPQTNHNEKPPSSTSSSSTSSSSTLSISTPNTSIPTTSTDQHYSRSRNPLPAMSKEPIPSTAQLTWKELVPANVAVTSWKLIEDAYQNGSLTELMENIHVQGYNVIQPTNSSGIFMVPFDVHVRYEFFKAAEVNQIVVLHEIEYKSLGKTFQETKTDRFEYSEAVKSSPAKAISTPSIPTHSPEDPHIGPRTAEKVDEGYSALIKATIHMSLAMLDADELFAVMIATGRRWSHLGHYERALFLNKLIAAWRRQWWDQLMLPGPWYLKNWYFLNSDDLHRIYQACLSESQASTGDSPPRHECRHFSSDETISDGSDLEDLKQSLQNNLFDSVVEDWFRRQPFWEDVQSWATVDHAIRHYLRVFLRLNHHVLEFPLGTKTLDRGGHAFLITTRSLLATLPALANQPKDDKSQLEIIKQSVYALENITNEQIEEVKAIVHSSDPSLSEDELNRVVEEGIAFDLRLLYLEKERLEDKVLSRHIRRQGEVLDHDSGDEDGTLAKRYTDLLAILQSVYDSTDSPSTSDIESALESTMEHDSGNEHASRAKVKRYIDRLTFLQGMFDRSSSSTFDVLEARPILLKRGSIPIDPDWDIWSDYYFPAYTSTYHDEDTSTTPPPTLTFSAPPLSFTKPSTSIRVVTSPSAISSPEQSEVQLSKLKRERIAWEAADLLKRIIDECVSPGGLDEASDFVKTKLALKGVEILSQIIETYFSRQDGKKARTTRHRRSLSNTIGGDAMNILDGFNPVIDAKTTFTEQQSGPKDASDAEMQYAPAQLDNNDKQEILSQFTNNCQGMLRTQYRNRRATASHNSTEDCSSPSTAEYSTDEEISLLEMDEFILQGFQQQVETLMDKWMSDGDLRKRINTKRSGNLNYGPRGQALDNHDAWAKTITITEHTTTTQYTTTTVAALFGTTTVASNIDAGANVVTIIIHENITLTAPGVVATSTRTRGHINDPRSCTDLDDFIPQRTGALPFTATVFPNRKVKVALSERSTSNEADYSDFVSDEEEEGLLKLDEEILWVFQKKVDSLIESWDDSALEDYYLARLPKTVIDGMSTSTIMSDTTVPVSITRTGTSTTTFWQRTHITTPTTAPTPTLNLEHLLRDFGACLRDRNCDVETEDFIEGYRKRTRDSASFENLFPSQITDAPEPTKRKEDSGGKHRRLKFFGPGGRPRMITIPGHWGLPPMHTVVFDCATCPGGKTTYTAIAEGGPTPAPQKRQDDYSQGSSAGDESTEALSEATRTFGKAAQGTETPEPDGSRPDTPESVEIVEELVMSLGLEKFREMEAGRENRVKEGYHEVHVKDEVEWSN